METGAETVSQASSIDAFTMLQRSHTFAALLALLSVSSSNGQNTSTAGPPWVESEYATSPPVYPSREFIKLPMLKLPKLTSLLANATGSGWEAAFEQASNFVSQLTLEEKVRLVTGTAGPCVGNIGPVPRLGFKGLCLQDGPLAIREADYASVFPAGLTTAASWDRRLAHVRGQDMADEFVGKGAHVALGPVAGPLGRSGYGGRNWEGFSPDPWLTGELFAETIVGMEERGIQACAKRLYILRS